MTNTIQNFGMQLKDQAEHALLRMKMRKDHLLSDESGIGTIELVLILVVLIALVVIFRDGVKKLLNDILTQLNTSATSVWSSGT